MKRVRHSVVAFGTTAAIISVIAAGVCARAPRAQAEDWPTRPLTLVVPFSAGGSSDTIGRTIADGISSNLRQPVVVENVAGAGGIVGGSRVAKPHLTAINSLSETSGPSPRASGSTRHHFYNAVTDFAPVALLTDESLVLVARNDFPADNLQRASTAWYRAKKSPAQRGALVTHSLLARRLISVTAIDIDVGRAHIAAFHWAVPFIRLGRLCGI